jgi:hypothetical protein
MKNKLLGILMAAVFAFCAAIFIGQPSNATNLVEREMLALGLVDEITTPEKLGLGYLSQQPIELTANSRLMDSIGTVNDKLNSIMPEDIPLIFSTGTNSPIAIREVSDYDTDNTGYSDYDYIGFRDNQNRRTVFYPKDGADMTNTEYRNSGNIIADLNSQQILIADTRNLFFQAKRIPIFNVFLKRKSDGRRYFVKNVNANAVCRDLLNAVLTGNLRNLATGEILIG